MTYFVTDLSVATEIEDEPAYLRISGGHVRKLSAARRSNERIITITCSATPGLRYAKRSALKSSPIAANRTSAMNAPCRRRDEERDFE
jgi:hypothetical protein